LRIGLAGLNLSGAKQNIELNWSFRGRVTRCPLKIKKEIQLEIAHVLFIDIVGYSRLSINDQHAAVEELNQIVRASEQFQRGEAASRLLKSRPATGWRWYFTRVLKRLRMRGGDQPRTQGTSPPALRMGIHSGPVSGVVDVNERANIAGAGINIAQRVMDCGDAGHILISKHAAEDLEEYEHWPTASSDLGDAK